MITNKIKREDGGNEHPGAYPGKEIIMTKRIVHTVFMHETGVYEAYLIDRENNIVGGYLLFGAYGKSNPYRTFPIADCRIEKV